MNGKITFISVYIYKIYNMVARDDKKYNFKYQI